MVTATVTDAEFAALARYLADAAGLVFDASRRPGLTSVVTDRLVAAGHDNVTDYLAHVASPEGADERQRLLDGVTIQETHFYRNGAQIEALRLHLLPELLRRAAAERRPLRVWSAGCSTGEEPYTLAMLILEVRAALRLDVDVVLVGTDVSAAAVAVAEHATYAGRTIELAEDGALQRWFVPVVGDPLAAERFPGERVAYRVSDEVRAPVSFRVHNLVTDEPPFAPSELDLVVCRNVTIYFARETTRALVERFHRVLRPGGFLVLGHAETLWQVSDAFALVPVAEAFAYRKDAVPAAQVEVAPRPRRARPTVRAVPRRRTAARVAAAPAPSVAPERTPAPRPTRGPGLDALIAARAAWADGSYDRVVELAGRATHADPLLTDAYVLRGQALSTLGDDFGALDALRKAVYLDPAAGHAHFLLAGALARLGQPEAAARAFRAAAGSLHLVSAEHVRFLLDGREVEELVALCGQLADASDRAARAASAAGRSPS